MARGFQKKGKEMKRGVTAAVSSYHRSSQAFQPSSSICKQSSSACFLPAAKFGQSHSCPREISQLMQRGGLATGLAAVVGKTQTGCHTSMASLAQGGDASTTGGGTEAYHPWTSLGTQATAAPSGSWRRTVLLLSFFSMPRTSGHLCQHTQG